MADIGSAFLALLGSPAALIQDLVANPGRLDATSRLWATAMAPPVPQAVGLPKLSSQAISLSASMEVGTLSPFVVKSVAEHTAEAKRSEAQAELQRAFTLTQPQDRLAAFERARTLAGEAEAKESEAQAIPPISPQAQLEAGVIGQLRVGAGAGYGQVF